ncbi:BA14K family protein [Neorhizobium alkalisoli]|uniref:BA14K family protein n=1 Tax=Neorhizobium alkalisoli TaxID=528178 RepID=UPI001474C68E|nr:BA14K family protein [Neorhizobium alkalisoli]
MKPILFFLASLVLLVLVFLSGVIITANVIAEPEPHKFAHMDTPDLWTTKPKQVDTADQNLERLPAVAASDPTAAPAPTPVAASTGGSEPTPDAIDNTVTASVGSKPSDEMTNPMPIAQDVGGTIPPSPLVTPAQAQWCFARYRSYRVEDNSYQPYGGSSRRQCKAPGATVTQAAAPIAEDVAAGPDDRQMSRDDGRPPQRQEIPYDDQPAYGIEADYAEPEAADSATPVGVHEEWCFGRYRSYRPDDNSYQPFDGGPRRACQSPYG